MLYKLLIVRNINKNFKLTNSNNYIFKFNVGIFIMVNVFFFIFVSKNIFSDGKNALIININVGFLIKIIYSCERV